MKSQILKEVNTFQIHSPNYNPNPILLYNSFEEAIYAQEELIGVLEGDIIVYEERVGILRDSLGASKDEERQHFRSKAYAAKIKALETENQEIIKLSKGEGFFYNVICN